MGRKLLSTLGGAGVLLLVASPMLLFLVVPLLSVLILSVTGKPYSVLEFLARLDISGLVREVAQNFTTRFYADFFRMPLFFASLKNTLVLGFWVTLSATFVGTFLAFAVERTSMPFRRLVHFLAIMPLVVPVFIGGYALTQLLGSRGALTGLWHMLGGTGALANLYTPFGIGFVQTFFLFPMVYLAVSAALSNIDSSLEEAAATQGAPTWYGILTTTLPMAWPGIAGGALLVFTNSIADYGTFGVLAPRGFPLIAVEAYRELTGYFNWGAASMLAVVMILLAVAVLILQKVWVERGHYVSVSGKMRAPKRIGGRTFGWVMFALSGVLLLPPVLGVVGTLYLSFIQRFGSGYFAEAYTLANYYRALIAAPKPIFNSLVLSLAATAIAISYALLVNYINARTRIRGRSVLDAMSILPFVVPGTAIAVALIVTFNQKPIQLHNTAWLLIIAYVVRRMPYAMRNLNAGFQQLDKSLDESAMVMGASRAYAVWTVIAPLLVPSILAGALLVFVTSIKEVSTSIMLSPAAWRPLSAHIYQLVLEEDRFTAAAYAVILIILIAVLQGLANRSARRLSPGER